jgi:HEAT repeat protein
MTALRFIASIVALGAIASVRPSGAANVLPDAHDLLGAIDFVPQKGDLDAAMASPLSSLISRAKDDAEDPGVRLRAIRALSQYPSTESKAALIDVINHFAAARNGTSVLHLRAAIEALGDIGTSDEVSVITPFLNADDSLDLRATAARALGVIRSPLAVSPLRARQQAEMGPSGSQEVLLAITEALRAILGGG